MKIKFSFIFLLILIIILSLFIFIIIHELTHFTVCSAIGLKGKMEINLLVNPPLFKTECIGINEKNFFQKFLFWGSPYIIGLFLISFFFLKKNKNYLVIQAGIPISNMFDLWFWYIKDPKNDLINILSKTNKVYFIITLIILLSTIFIFLFNIIKKKNNSNSMEYTNKVLV